MRIQKTTMQQEVVSNLFFDTFRKITLSVSSYFSDYNDLIQAYNFFPSKAYNGINELIFMAICQHNKKLLED
jgi:hypothetical protein